MVADRFAKNKYVAGFDPLNEPSVGLNKTLVGALAQLLPGNMDKSVLNPLYTRVFDKLKAADSNSIMMFEMPPFPDQLGVNLFGKQFDLNPAVGFAKPPGAEIGSKNHALNFHTYCCAMNFDVCAETGEPLPKYLDSGECRQWH